MAITYWAHTDGCRHHLLCGTPGSLLFGGPWPILLDLQSDTLVVSDSYAAYVPVLS